MAVVVIRIRIGKLVMVSMQTHLVDGAVLATQCPAGRKKTLKPGGQMEGAVCQQAVITNRDTQAGGDPVQNKQAGERWQAPEARKQGYSSKDMDHDHESNRDGMLVILPSGVGLAFARFMEEACLRECQVRCCRPAGRRQRSDCA